MDEVEEIEEAVEFVELAVITGARFSPWEHNFLNSILDWKKECEEAEEPFRLSWKQAQVVRGLAVKLRE